MYSEERKEQLIRLCQSVIREKSYSGHENRVAEVFKNAMQDMGFNEVHTDKYGNVIGCVLGNRPGATLLFDGHIDTVPANPDQWNHDPWGAEIDHNRIYGRGTSDMKGADTAMLAGIANFAEDTHHNFAGKIYFSCSVHEECFEGIAPREVTKQFKPDIVIIGESTELNLNIGQRGRAEITIETYGKTAHSANPEKGINAIYSMQKVLNGLKNIPLKTHPILQKGIFEVTDIKSSPYPGASVVPDYCKITIDRRLLVNETAESVLKPFQDLVDGLAKEDDQFKAKVSITNGEEVCYTGEKIGAERFFPGWVVDEDDKRTQAVLKKLHENGIPSKISHYSFCTNGSHYAGEAGIFTLGFGPSRENQAHVVDEYIEISQLIEASEGYYLICDALLNEEVY